MHYFIPGSTTKPNFLFLSNLDPFKTCLNFIHSFLICFFVVKTTLLLSPLPDIGTSEPIIKNLSINFFLILIFL